MMQGVLLDTTVASLFHPRRKGSTAWNHFTPHWQNRIISISFQTYGELWMWAEQRRWGYGKRAVLSAMFNHFVLLPFTPALGHAWARVMAEARRGGRRLEAGDAWIAATAVLYKLPLLTTDDDFVDLAVEGLEVIGGPS